MCPIVPIAIWRLLMRSCTAHCDLALAVEVRAAEGERRKGRRKTTIYLNNYTKKHHLTGRETLIYDCFSEFNILKPSGSL